VVVAAFTLVDATTVVGVVVVSAVVCVVVVVVATGEETTGVSWSEPHPAAQSPNSNRLIEHMLARRREVVMAKM